MVSQTRRGLIPRQSGRKDLHGSEDAAMVTVDKTVSSGAAIPVRRYVVGFKDVCALKDGKSSSVKYMRAETQIGT